MNPLRVINPQVICPVDLAHGIQAAAPSGFRGIRLACGCELLALDNNSGWVEKNEYLARLAQLETTPHA